MVNRLSSHIEASSTHALVEYQWGDFKHDPIQEHLRHLREIHDHQEPYWHRASEGAERASGAGYDEAANLLTEPRAVAEHFNEVAEFQARFRDWVRPHLRRPALAKRLRERRLTLPEA